MDFTRIVTIHQNIHKTLPGGNIIWERFGCLSLKQLERDYPNWKKACIREKISSLTMHSLFPENICYRNRNRIEIIAFMYAV